MIEEICQNKDSWFLLGIVTLCKEIFEYWLGKTNKVSAGSSLELIINFFIKKKTKNKESSMEMGKLHVDLAAGKVEMSYDMGSEGMPALVELKLPLGMIVSPLLAQVEAKLASGEIDPIKGTDLDKEVLLKGLAELKKLLA